MEIDVEVGGSINKTFIGSSPLRYSQVTVPKLPVIEPEMNEKEYLQYI